MAAMKPKQRASPPISDGYGDDKDDDHDNYDDEKPLSSYLKPGRGRKAMATPTHSEKHHEARPLIDGVTNSSKHTHHHHRRRRRHSDGASVSSSDDFSDDDDFGHRELTHCCDWEDPDSLVNTLATFFKNRRVRRTMLAVTLLLSGLFFYYMTALRPVWMEESRMQDSFNEPLGTFGMQDWKKFPDITQIVEMEADVLPGGVHDADGLRRLVFVGDVHGCDRELRALMQKIKFDKERDHLVCTGDVVSKGPDSLGVIDTLISLNATSVRGNHEDKVVVGAGRKGFEAEMSDETRKERAKGTKGVELARFLKPHHLAWLRALPLILHVPAPTPPSVPAPAQAQPDLEDPLLLDILDSLSDTSSSNNKKKKKKKQKTNPFLFNIATPINIVHGGLVPGVPLRRQDPYAVMNMRSMSPTSHVPSSKREKGRPWEDMWNWYHDRLARHKPPKKWSWFESEYELSDAGLAAQAEGTLAVESEDEGGFWGWLGGLFGGGEEKKVDELLELKVEEASVVVYGHDSPRGLNLRDWTKGLDTGCVRGGHLTAMVLDAWGRAHLVQVKCRDYM